MARNTNPRQLRRKSCTCPLCTEHYRPGETPTRKDCTGSWQARYRNPAGEQKQPSFHTKREAQAHLDKVRTQMRERTYLDPGRASLTLAQWHAKRAEARRGADTTLERDDYSWSCHLEPAFGKWKIIDIGYNDIDAWVTRMTRTTGRTAIVKAVQLLDRLMAAAVRDRRINHNPCDGVTLPKPKAKHPDDLRPPSYRQLADIRAQIPRHYHPLLLTEEESGLRWGEMIDLRLQWVDFAGGLLQVREVIVETTSGGLVRKEQPKSSAGFRTVPLTGKAADAIRRAMADREVLAARTAGKKAGAVPKVAGTKSAPGDGMHEEELVFLGPKGGVLSRHNFRRLWLSAIKSTGIARMVVDPVTKRREWWPTFHDIRHAYASRLADEGVPETTVQLILGHERGGKVTWLYQHAPEEAVENVRQVLDPGRRLRVVGSA